MRNGMGSLGGGVAALVALSTAGAAAIGDDPRPAHSKPVDSTAALPAPPPRIVSTNLPTDEILIGLNTPGIVALSRYADDPKISNIVDQARRVPYHVRGNAERILSLGPGVVFTFPFGQQATEHLLRQADVPVVHVAPVHGLSDLRARIRRLGTIVGREERADALIADMDAELAAVRHRVEGVSRPRTLLWHAGGNTAGADTVFDELLEAAGGRNVAAEAGIRGRMPLPLERALALDPEVIFVVTYRADARAREVLEPPSLAERPRWQTVGAVRNGRVYSLPARHVLSGSHHAVHAARDMARRLHPERFDPGGSPARRGSPP